MLVCLGLAALASAIGLAAIVGAFLADDRGRNPRLSARRASVRALYALFTSFFFVFIGAGVDLDALASVSTLLLLAALTVLSFGVKYLACWFAARPLGSRDARIVGLGRRRGARWGSSSPGWAPPRARSTRSCSRFWWRSRFITSLLAPPLLRRAARAGPPEHADVPA
jgi:hypothetical protein